MAARECDSCNSAAAVVFCRADSAFLCAACDGEVHSANRFASRHERVKICEVCEQAPAAIFCKADAAMLCAACDADVHSANPLARRHDRQPVVPFRDSPPLAGVKLAGGESLSPPTPAPVPAIARDEEEEALSWLIPEENHKVLMDIPDLKEEMDFFFFSDADYASCMEDSVVPVQPVAVAGDPPAFTACFDQELGGSATVSLSPSVSPPTAKQPSSKVRVSDSVPTDVVVGGGDGAGGQRDRGGDEPVRRRRGGGAGNVPRGEADEVQGEAEQPPLREDDPLRFPEGLRRNQASRQGAVCQAGGGGGARVHLPSCRWRRRRVPRGGLRLRRRPFPLMIAPTPSSVDSTVIYPPTNKNPIFELAQCSDFPVINKTEKTSKLISFRLLISLMEN